MEPDANPVHSVDYAITGKSVSKLLSCWRSSVSSKFRPEMEEERERRIFWMLPLHILYLSSGKLR